MCFRRLRSNVAVPHFKWPFFKCSSQFILWHLKCGNFFYIFRDDGRITISTICQSAEYILELYIRIQIRTIQLLIFTEKFSPLLGFEPGTSPLYQADMLPIELSWLGNWLGNLRFSWTNVFQPLSASKM